MYAHPAATSPNLGGKAGGEFAPFASTIDEHQKVDLFYAPNAAGHGQTNSGGYISSLTTNGSPSSLSASQDGAMDGKVISGSLVPSNTYLGSYEPSADFVYIGRWRAPTLIDGDTPGNPTGPAFFQFVAGKPATETSIFNNTTPVSPWLQYSLSDPSSNSYVTAKRPDGSIDYDAGYFENANLLLDPYTASTQFDARVMMMAYGSQNESSAFTVQRNSQVYIDTDRVAASPDPALCSPNCTSNSAKFSIMAFLGYAGVSLSFNEANLGDVYGTAVLDWTGNSLSYAETGIFPHQISNLDYLAAPLSNGNESMASPTIRNTNSGSVTVTTLSNTNIDSISDQNGYWLGLSPAVSNGEGSSVTVGYQGEITQEGGQANTSNDFAYLGAWTSGATISGGYGYAANANIFVLGHASPWTSVQSKGQEQGGTLYYEYSPGSNPSTVMAVRPDNSVDPMAGTLNSAQIQVDTSMAQATVSADLNLNAYNGVSSKNLAISSNPITMNSGTSDPAAFTGNILVTNNTLPLTPVPLPGIHTASGMIMNVDANSQGQAGLVMRFLDPDMGQIGAGAILQGMVP